MNSDRIHDLQYVPWEINNIKLTYKMHSNLDSFIQCSLKHFSYKHQTLELLNQRTREFSDLIINQTSLPPDLVRLIDPSIRIIAFIILKI